jgi:carbon monoxide dehydrogenase subunit G
MRIGRSNLPPPPLVGCARALLAMLLLVGSASAAADSPIRSIEVAYDGETYVVNAIMFAPVGQAVAWEVLTDFDHVAQWVPNVAESKVLKREDTSVTVQQRGVARVGAVSFPYVTERRIELKPPNGIRTVQLKGSLRRVESSILLEPDGKGTRIRYRLEIVPSVLARTVMSERFLEHEVDEQFSAIVGEMVRRAP